MLNLKEYLKEMVKMNQQIDAEKLINILVEKSHKLASKQQAQVM